MARWNMLMWVDAGARRGSASALRFCTSTRRWRASMSDGDRGTTGKMVSLKQAGANDDELGTALCACSAGCSVVAEHWARGDDGECRCAAGHARAKAIAGRAGKWFLARKQARTPMRKARCISIASAGGRWRTMLDDGALDRGRLGAGFEPLAARARAAGGAAATRGGD